MFRVAISNIPRYIPAMTIRTVLIILAIICFAVDFVTDLVNVNARVKFTPLGLALWASTLLS